MKLFKLLYFLLLIAFIFSANVSFAQADRDTTETKVKKIFVITTNSGGEFVGIIISQDDKEVLIETKDRGRVSIPKYEIREMKEVKGGEMTPGGVYIPEEIFATRYFLTTNGLPIEKGESYVLWNLFGPEIHFGVAKNFSIGGMTSWVGIPIVGSIKYSIKLGESTSIGVGTLLGTGSWAAPDFFIALPYAGLTFGGRRANINFMAGYGYANGFEDNSEGSGTALYSIGGLAKISKKASFVFDSIFVINQNSGSSNGVYGLLIPGIRVQGKMDAAFQFGFAGFIAGDEGLVPAPIPMLGWFKKL